VAITTSIGTDGIGIVVMDAPPVNALTSHDWHAIAQGLQDLGRNPDCRVVVLRAEGRGFNAGVDIKELALEGGGSDPRALVEVNRGCYAAFAAVYECEVPVIAQVHGFCLGGGIGLIGNADIIVASDDAYFGLPEVDRGALGAATHLARMVPQHKMRAMVYLAQNATAAELHAFGAIHSVVPREDLAATTLALAETIAQKSPTIIRRAKEALTGIDPVDPRPSYRFEQGLTYELTLRGAADEARHAFVDKRDAEFDQ
jgi:enoyl-CoA hydratase